MNKTILSLFDFSGRWSDPYRDAGYSVHQVDIKLGSDIFNFDYSSIESVYGILAAPPCTDFSLSGSRFFKRKDADGTTEKSVALVKKMMEIINFYDPTFWVVENPMSRIHKLVPELGSIKYKFHPYHHGDPYQKTTWLWGKFNIPDRNEVEPTGGRLIYKVGGKSEATKEFRSMTPLGFAQAFFEANQ
jgi:hypothetical protein